MNVLFKRLKARFTRAWAKTPFEKKCCCCICGATVGCFLPYRGGLATAPPLMAALNVIGGNLESHECPSCGCHDRERHLLLYLRATRVLDQMSGRNILHLAPETNLQSFIRAVSPRKYVLGDLHPSSPNVDRIDVQALPFATGSFDFLIANHLLEHVNDLPAALSEISRVLADGGLAILQTPFSPVLSQTFEDRGVISPQARLHAFGQEDHVRLFGKDLVEIVERFGFTSRFATHASVISEFSSERYGVNANEPFMLFVRTY